MPKKQWQASKTEKEYWTVKCPNCGRYQCKERNMYGREVKKASCIYCNAKIFLATCGALYSKTEAQNIVMTKNAILMKDQNVLEFRTYKKKKRRGDE